MNIKANYFYNYKTVGDVLMAIIDNDALPTSSKSFNNITLIYSQDTLIGINFFNISEIVKIKSIGKIVLPPVALIDVLNSMLKEIGDYQLDYITDSMFVIGKILSVEEHPESDHLHLLKVDIKDEVLDIVCGARNVEVNKLCVVAKVGAMMMDGSVIRPGKLLGEVSNGMCCSAKELGIDIPYIPHHLLLLDEENVEVGQDFFLTKGGY